MRTILISAASALAASGGLAFAQHAPPSPPPPPPAADPAQPPADDDATLQDEIVVLAERGDQVRIDRRTYTLRDDPAAQATDMFEVLGRVPSVSVAPSGAITLLGADNVEIQINGQPVPGDNLEQVLRGLTGSEVERIEVITNPSAQYSAQASGGIINIITKRRAAADGLSGSIQASAETTGGYGAGISITWTEGPWTLSGQIGLYNGQQEGDFTRTRETFATGDVIVEDGAREFNFSGWYANRLQAGYRFDDRRRASLAYNTGTFEFEQEQRTATSDDTGPLSQQALDVRNEHENSQLIFDYEQRGDRDREVMKINAALNRFNNLNRNAVTLTPVLGAESAFNARAEQDVESGNIKLDFEQPLPLDWFLTWGAAFDYTDQENTTDFVTTAGPPVTPDYTSLLEGRNQTLAGYGTLQFATGDWTWLPGVRGELYRREVAAGALESDTTDSRVFPTLHIRRELTPEINVDLSYTARITRPGFGQLDPTRRYLDVNRAFSGNPNLEPTTADAYEANFTYSKDGANFSLTFYDRISDDIVSQLTELGGDGVIVTMPVNAGTSEQRGLQALLRGPFDERWRYSLTANMLQREFDYLDAGVIARREEFEYDGAAQLDYRDPDQTAIGANQFQFEVRFQGPRFGLQNEFDEFAFANFTWRRRLTDTIFGVLMVQDIFDSTDQVTRVTTDDYFEETRFGGGGARLRLSLTYQFGANADRAPQDQGPPQPQIPMQ